MTRRGFTIHQKVVLEIDFAGAVRGYTEITVVPTTKGLRTIHLHCRQCKVHAVTVAGERADFVHHDALANITVSNPNDAHHHPELKRKLYSALAEGDEGELSIGLPSQAVVVQSTNGKSVSGEEIGAVLPSGSRSDFSPITVNIEYSIWKPAEGLQFVLPSEAYPYRVPHMFTTPSCPDAARCWVPCVDNLWERCTWDFEFVVPKYLEERRPRLVMEDEDRQEVDTSPPTIVVCSGELVEQVSHPFNSSKTIFLFSQPVPTSVQHIAFASGPFHVHIIPTERQETRASDEASSQPLMHAFCLPGQEHFLTTSVGFLRSAMTFFTTDYGSYPFASYKVVFVDELPSQSFESATLSLVTMDLLHSKDAIDQVYETRHALSYSLACQWVGIHIIQRTWSDTWLVNGLCLYITGLFLRKLLGNNEYRFRLKKDMDRVVERDIGLMPPLCMPNSNEPPDLATLPFVNIKAPIVLHILDRRLGKSGTALGLARVLPKLFLSAISGEMQLNALGTNSFLRMCRRVSGVDLRTFADQWIYGSGCPRFGFQATFNRKRMAVEFIMRQDCPAYKNNENDPARLATLNPVQLFEGQMTVRIHEADGTPYEHVLDVRAPTKKYEVPFNTKYKRVRRNTKRYLARQAAAQAAAEGDNEAVEAMQLVDLGFGLDIWENERERDYWKVTDWTEEEEQAMAGATYEWIRIDADFEWICSIAFEQPDFMWVSQLQRDRDVVAQLEAVNALARMPSAVVSSTLTKTVLVTNYFFRIRMEAALALPSCAIRRIDFLGLYHLFKIFLSYCYEPQDKNQDLFVHKYVPRPNDFSVVSEYFVRKAALTAISRVRFENGKTPTIVRQFLVDQLRYNDNTVNPCADAVYISTIISSLACASVSTSAPERGLLAPHKDRSDQTEEDVALLQSAVTEVERYRSMDRLVPTTHNIVTVACMEWHLVLQMANLLPREYKTFLMASREGNFTQVRLAGFDGLFLSKWWAPKMTRYILAVLANDPNRVVRRHIARSLCESLSILVNVGDIKSALKDTEALLIEEDPNNPDKGRGPQKTEIELMLKAIRKDREVGKNEVLREHLMPLMLSPGVDHEVRLSLLKLADLTVRGKEEEPPKNVLRIPLTPIIETAPAIPSPLTIRPPLKPGRSARNVTNDIRPTLPKIKLSTGAAQASGAPVTASPAGSRGNSPAPESAKPRPPTFVVPKVPRKTKETHKLKAQASGLSLKDTAACRMILKKLVANKLSILFRQPVDPVRDQALDYFKIIRRPMDLSTMSAHLEAGQYKDRFEFEADFRLMIQNAHTYNSPDTFVAKQADRLNEFFDNLWSKTAKTLDSADGKGEKPKEPGVPVPQPAAAAPPPRAASPAVNGNGKPSTTIKLTIGGKLGGARKADGAPKRSSEQPPKKKARVAPSPAPAAIDPEPEETDLEPEPEDDGSADLLEEVIAIEEQRKRKVPAVNGSHRPSTPSRKEESRPTPVPSTPVHAVAHPATGIPTPSSTPGPVRTPKGKEKAKESQPLDVRKCKEILRTIGKMPESVLFSRPVDPIADGCPSYLEEIKEPMDFGTMGKKVDSGEYITMDDFGADAERVFNNCRQFNYAGTYPVQMADAVQKVWAKEWSKAIVRRIGFQDKRKLQGILTRVVQEDVSWAFREPVDPIALGIPHYHSIVPKRDARDLRTIRKKLDEDRYENIEAFEVDVRLMCANAIKFNGLESEVGRAGVTLENRILDDVEGVRSAERDKKRNGSALPGSIVKKQRVI